MKFEEFAKDFETRCRARGVPVIVATQVLESMRTEPRPTRADRPGLPALVEKLSVIDGLDDIAMTTNGVLLPRHAVDLHLSAVLVTFWEKPLECWVELPKTPDVAGSTVLNVERSQVRPYHC